MAEAAGNAAAPASGAAPSGSANLQNVHASAPIGAMPSSADPVKSERAAKPAKKKPKPPADETDDDDDDAGGGDAGMTEDLTDLCRITLAEGGALPDWIQMFPEGEYDHPKGRLRFDQAFHERVTRNLNDRVRQIEIAVDKDHENKAAYAWVDRAEYRPGHGSWAHLRTWTPPGADLVRSETYKYISPQFGTFTDPKSGKRYDDVVTALSLTNFPYIKDMAGLGQINLSELSATAAAKGKTATAKNPDPDDDGDDDSTEAGDTDHDYTGPDGKRKPKAKAKSGESQMTEEGYERAAIRLAEAAASYAGPHESFPIKNCNDVKDAWDLAGHAKDPDAVRAKVKSIASSKGLSRCLPKSAAADNDGQTRAHEARQELSMPETTTPAADPGQTALAEQDAIKRLAATEAKQIATERALAELQSKYAETQKALDEAGVRESLRSLSEAKTVALTDDEGKPSNAKVTTGIPTSVLKAAQGFMLSEPQSREPILTILRMIQHYGTVNLSEQGVGRSQGRDPYSLDDAADPTGEKAVEQAIALCESKGQNFYKLSDGERVKLLAKFLPKA